ncbi:hypothetical protein DFR50_1111 [Roseiarcus fermentans]|uniref:Secreted protein with PEP-CTERM sorting signal n=1 Tax=Roseiarcus fermentans TaxID=1473586 RepID=A0A366FJ45_9HYPH|nr:hypothetical protein [Roseiarcus fermentans]RBP13739.1 hypothetical protein DFR50_1111 [Roseiarcus fermentans]
MRYLVLPAAFLLAASTAALARGILVAAPAPGMDLGVAGLVMVAGAALLVRWRR